MSSVSPATEILTEKGPALPSTVPPSTTAMVDAVDHRLLRAMQDGLALVSRPYLAVAEQLGLTEDEVLRRLHRLLDCGVIKRLGVVVRHHELGYRANAMVVWNIPDDTVDVVGRRLASCEAVRLCYQRPRHLPHWPYNLFCMIHGRDRESVEDRISELTERCGLQDIDRQVLFSVRRFKQRGARYAAATDMETRQGVTHEKSTVHR